MGLISGLLLLPIMGPVHGFRFVLERLHEDAEAALRDEGRAFAELIDLSMRHAAGQLTDAEFAEQESAMLERLSTLREYRDGLLHEAAEGAQGDEFEQDLEEGQEPGDELEPAAAGVDEERP